MGELEESWRFLREIRLLLVEPSRMEGDRQASPGEVSDLSPQDRDLNLVSPQLFLNHSTERTIE